MKTNFTISGIEDGTDTSRIIDLANKVIEKHNDKNLKKGEFLTVTFGDDREYNVKITPENTIISIHRVK